MKNSRVTLEELIIKESRIIATDLLRQKLAAQGLPLPKDSALELHVDQIIAHDPSIRQSARERVDAKSDAYTAGLRLLGLVPEIAQPVEIDL